MSEARAILYRGTYYAEWRDSGIQRRRTLRTKNYKEAIERLDIFLWDRNAPFQSMMHTKPNTIYFITCLDFVKIGTASDPYMRLAQLQIGNPFPLVLAAVIEGSLSYERHLHKQFAAYDHNGEWFHLKGDLAEFVTGLPPAQNETDIAALRKAKAEDDINGLLVFEF